MMTFFLQGSFLILIKKIKSSRCIKALTEILMQILMIISIWSLLVTCDSLLLTQLSWTNCLGQLVLTKKTELEEMGWKVERNDSWVEMIQFRAETRTFHYTNLFSYFWSRNHNSSPIYTIQWQFKPSAHQYQYLCEHDTY